MLTASEISEDEYRKICAVRPISFLQRPEWAEFKQAVGEYQPRFFQLSDSGSVIGGFAALGKKIRFLPGFLVYYVPRTLLVFECGRLLDRDFFTRLLKAIEQINLCTAIEFNYPYYDSKFPEPDEFKRYIEAEARKAGYAVAGFKVQPRSSIIKPIFSEDLWGTISSANGRRNIKRALKRTQGTKIKFIVKAKLSDPELTAACALISGISREKKFTTRTLRYFETLQQIMNNLVWFLFRDDATDKIVLANLGVIDPISGTYYDLYVGRDLKYDSYYLSYLLKYNSFEYLRDSKIRFYDHWGIDLDPRSAQYGFSLFKMHFGGKIVNYPKIIVVSRWKRFAKAGIKLLNFVS